MPMVEALSDALGLPVEELPPLSQSISVDGLDALLNGEDTEDVTVSFRYAGFRVVVHSDGLVYVRPLETEGLPTGITRDW